MKDKVIYVLAILVGTAIITAIVGDYEIGRAHV